MRGPVLLNKYLNKRDCSPRISHVVTYTLYVLEIRLVGDLIGLMSQEIYYDIDVLIW